MFGKIYRAMRTVVYLISILLMWLSFFFGVKAQAQTVQFFMDGNTNSDIELSPQGHLWGVVYLSDSHESGFEQMSMDAQVMHYQTFANTHYQYIGANAQFIAVSDPENNKIYKYSHMGQQLACITEVDNPGNVVLDAEGNIYTIETDLKKLVKFSPTGVRSVVVADNWLYQNSAITIDPEGNLYTANRFTGQIFRWEKATGELYPFAQLPTGTLCADGSQISEIVYSHGKLYVASVGLSAIYKVDQVGTVTLLAGTPGISAELNDVASKARFVKPVGIAASVTGDSIFVSDNGKIRVIKGIDATAGIQETAADTEALIYPNPATDHLQIKLSGAQTSGRFQWRLIGQDGRTVEAGTTYPADGNIALYFSTQPCGSYYIELTGNAKTRIVQSVLLCAK